MTTSPFKSPSLLIALLSIGSAVDLPAQDFFGGGVTARTAGRAGVYVPASDNALDALSINPAGLSSLTGNVVNLSATGLLAHGSFSNVTNQDSPMRFTAGVVPYGAAGIPLGTRWTIGAGFMPDLLSSAKWQFTDAPGAAGATYGEQHETSQITAFRTTAGIAYRVSSKLSVGATLGAIYNSNTLEMPYVFQSHPALQGLKTLLNLHTTGLGWNTSFGVVARPSRRWEVGTSYRSKTAITSSGDATGNMGQQFAALQIPFRPDFAYKAQVRVEVPQSAAINASWQKSSVLRMGFQASWTNWNSSFADLPVSLTQGTNADINGFLKSNSLNDTIPLHWKDQFSFGAFAERNLGESFTLSGGYVHRNNPVPASTLSPMTAAILSNGLTAGAGYKRGRAHFDFAYQINLPTAQSVGKSSLLSGEFGQSRTKVGTQALTISTSFRL